MALASGTRIGAYEVSAQIGVGGMGEVYRALDTNLKRQVAIKVLPASLAGDPERLARFQREAEVLAQLNHPNIAAIYGLEKTDGHTALVLELVEGPTLADRIAAGPIPADEALALATQIAEALDAAHEQGIVHRDLKPGNIKVRDDGTVKVLDFGLAKLAQRDASGSNTRGVSELATLTSPALVTGAGVILGTAVYMAPEQARGRSVDKRADIWAFGCVLYEMLTGERAFRGDDVTETLAAIVRDQPDLGEVPPQARALVARCLEKDPRKRLRDLGDRVPLLGAPDQVAADGRARDRVGRLVWPGVAAAAVVVAAVAFWAPWRGPVTGVPPVSFDVPPPADSSFYGANFAMSADGQAIAFFVRGSDGLRRLAIRRMDSTTTRVLPNTEDAAAVAQPGLAWSADGRLVAFATQDSLRTVDISTAEVRTLCQDCGQPSSWSGDGGILTERRGGGNGIHRVSIEDGSSVAVSSPPVDAGDLYPLFLPDGRHFVFFRNGAGRNGIYLGSLDEAPDAQDPRLILETPQTNLAFAPSPVDGTGTILFARGETLMALPFDDRRLAVTGAPVRVLDSLGKGAGGIGFFAASASGILAYRKGSSDRVLTWFDRRGAILGTAGPGGEDVTLDPDGLRAAYSDGGTVWILDLRRGLRTRLTERPGRAGVWSPTGDRVAFESEDFTDIWVRAANGTGTDQLLVESERRQTPHDWSPDGRFLLYSADDPETRFDLWVKPLDGGQPRAVVRSMSDDIRGQFSPDGRWIAYQSGAMSTSQVHVVPFEADGDGVSERITIDGGWQPRWSADGRSIFYRADGDALMMAVDVRPGTPFTAGTPVQLFVSDGPGPGSAQNAYYDVTPDGQRFLVTTFPPENVSAPITVMTNWRLDQTR